MDVNIVNVHKSKVLNDTALWPGTSQRLQNISISVLLLSYLPVFYALENVFIQCTCGQLTLYGPPTFIHRSMQPDLLTLVLYPN